MAMGRTLTPPTHQAPATHGGGFTHGRTPVVDQFDIAHTARNLLDLYRELDSAKRHQVVREARVTRPAPGPQAPSPTHLLSLEVELTDRLFELIRDCANHIQPTKILTHDGVRLCGWIAWHAGDIAELDFATDLHDEMQDQIRLIKHKVDNLPGANTSKETQRPEPWQLPEAIIQQAGRAGHTITRDQLRQWASRGHITARARGNRATYRASEVLARLTSEH